MAPKNTPDSSGSNPIPWRVAREIGVASGTDTHGRTVMALLRGKPSKKISARAAIIRALRARGLGHLIPVSELKRERVTL